MSDENRKPRRWAWFLAGIVFLVLVAGAVARFAPIIDCPSCDSGTHASPQAGEVVGTACHACENGRMTLWQYLQDNPVPVELPKIGK